jgi:hypothetical protein
MLSIETIATPGRCAERQRTGPDGSPNKSPLFGNLFSADSGWRARHRRERGRAVGSGVVGQADEHEPARAGRLPASVGRDRGQVQCPGDRLDAHGAPLLRHTTPQGAPGLLSQFLSHSPLTATVHRRPPRSRSGRSRTVADIGERWPALLESVLGATPQEFESPILRHL